MQLLGKSRVGGTLFCSKLYQELFTISENYAVDGKAAVELKALKLSPLDSVCLCSYKYRKVLIWPLFQNVSVKYKVSTIFIECSLCLLNPSLLIRKGCQHLTTSCVFSEGMPAHFLTEIMLFYYVISFNLSL